MTTKIPRINMSYRELRPNLLHNIENYAPELIAKLKCEDFYLTKIAEALDRPDAKTYSHDEVWK